MASLGSLMARLSFRCDEDLVARVDEARGLIPRETWMRDQIQRAVDGQPFYFTEDGTAMARMPRSSSQSKRDVSPRPKKAKP